MQETGMSTVLLFLDHPFLTLNACDTRSQPRLDRLRHSKPKLLLLELSFRILRLHCRTSKDVLKKELDFYNSHRESRPEISWKDFGGRKPCCGRQVTTVLAHDSFRTFHVGMLRTPTVLVFMVMSIGNSGTGMGRGSPKHFQSAFVLRSLKVCQQHSTVLQHVSSTRWFR